MRHKGVDGAFERKPDGGLSEWIETYEAMGGGENDAEILCLLLELRRRRENQAEAEAEAGREREGLMVSALAVADAWVRRAKAAEAEIERRDAAAGEAFAYIDGSHLDQFGWGYVFKQPSPMRSGCKLPVYAAAPSGVISDDALREAVRAWLSAPYPGPYVYGKMRKALGAQPQKPVSMPGSVRINNGYYFDMDDIFVALDAANVAYEVKK